MDADAIRAALLPETLAPKIAEPLGLSVEPVTAALSLLAQGALPAFVIRFRPEHVVGLSIRDLERVQGAAARAAAFEFRREEARSSLRSTKHPDAFALGVASHIAAATDFVDLDDLKVATRRRKRGPATKARGAGLSALADKVWTAGSSGPFAVSIENFDPATFDVNVEAEQARCEGFDEAQSVLDGVRALCAEQIAEFPPVRRRLRQEILVNGKLESAVVEEKKEKAGRYSRFFEWSEPCKKLNHLNVLMITRGERDGVLDVSVEFAPDKVREIVFEELGVQQEHPLATFLAGAVDEAWQFSLGRAVCAGVRKLIKERADRDAIAEFCDALRPLLLAPAFGQRPVLAVDPGFQNGCRIAVVGANGELVAEDTVFPLTPKLQVPQTKARIAQLCQEHKVEAIVVQHGNGGREIERLCRGLVREVEELAAIVVVGMDPDVASVQASSKQAKEEFPQADTALRRCVSAARRLQDPLLELVKIDPRKLGLGQHQHEVDQEELRSAFDQVLVSAVSSLGIDVNTASADHLRRVAGLSQALSKAVVAFREAREGIRTRADLLDVPGIPGKAFEQASGFLRVRNGENPLDDSLIHPERYGQVTQMARDLGVTVTDLLGSDELIDQLDRSKYLGTHGTSGEPLGELSWDLLIAELRHPGVDPRPPFAAVDFDPQVAGFEDLQVGMDLDGIVTHLAAFGAFVDVGIAQEGLVHVSELCHGYIASPLDAVHVGQRVRGRVIELLPERKRFSLSLKALQPRPPSGKPRPQDSKTRKKKKRPGTDRTRGRDRDKPKDRVLEFRMDLSGLADLLDKS